MAVSRIYGDRINFYQHFIVPGRRFFHLLELQNAGWSVFRAYDRFHTYPPTHDALFSGLRHFQAYQAMNRVVATSIAANIR